LSEKNEEKQQGKEIMMLIATGFQTEIKFYGKYRAKKVSTNRNQALLPKPMRTVYYFVSSKNHKTIFKN